VLRSALAASTWCCRGRLSAFKACSIAWWWLACSMVFRSGVACRNHLTHRPSGRLRRRLTQALEHRWIYSAVQFFGSPPRVLSCHALWGFAFGLACSRLGRRQSPSGFGTLPYGVNLAVRNRRHVMHAPSCGASLLPRAFGASPWLLGFHQGSCTEDCSNNSFKADGFAAA
jgi:hypothetical protein